MKIKGQHLLRFSKITIAYAVCIIAVVFVGPFVTDNVAAYIGEMYYKVMVGIGIIAYFSLYVLCAVRNKAGVKNIVLLLAVFSLVLCNAALIDQPDEKLHLVEYNILGCLCMWDMSKTYLPRWKQLAYACLCAGAVGCLDESLQGVVPWRTWQISDYVHNFAGGCSGVVMFFLCTRRPDKTA